MLDTTIGFNDEDGFFYFKLKYPARLKEWIYTRLIAEDGAGGMYKCGLMEDGCQWMS